MPVYKNAGISLNEEEIKMADVLAQRRHLNGRTALFRQLLWQEWERTFGQPNPGVTVGDALEAAEQADMPLAKALETIKRVAGASEK